MIDNARDMDRLITRWLDDEADQGGASYLAETLGLIAGTPQRQWTGRIKRSIGFEMPVFGNVGRPVQVAIVLLLLALAVVASLMIVGSQRRVAPPIGPAGNGVIGYASDDGLTFLLADGSGAMSTRLRGIGIDSNVSFSPDGTRVAFLSRRPGTEIGQGPERLFVAPLDAGEGAHDIAGALPVWNMGDLQFPLAWSPDSTRLAYTAFDLDTNRVVIAIVPVAGGPTKTITPDEQLVDYSYPEWSPDGQWLTVRAYSDQIGPGTRLVLMHPDGTDRRVLARTSTRAQSFTRVAWSPDGSQLAYNREDDPEGGGFHVARYDIATGEETAVNPPPTVGIDPSWSPDGQSIAYYEAPAPQQTWSVVIADADGNPTTRRNLGPIIAPGCGISWSPDSRYLLGYAVGCDGQLVVVPVDDPSKLVTLSAPGAHGIVNWQRVAP